MLLALVCFLSVLHVQNSKQLQHAKFRLVSFLCRQDSRKEQPVHLTPLARKFTSMVTIIEGRYSVQTLATSLIVRKSNPNGGRDFVHSSRPTLGHTQPLLLHTQRVGGHYRDEVAEA